MNYKVSEVPLFTQVLPKIFSTQILPKNLSSSRSSGSSSNAGWHCAWNVFQSPFLKCWKKFRFNGKQFLLQMECWSWLSCPLKIAWIELTQENWSIMRSTVNLLFRKNEKFTLRGLMLALGGFTHKWQKLWEPTFVHTYFSCISHSISVVRLNYLFFHVIYSARPFTFNPSNFTSPFHFDSEFRWNPFLQFHPLFVNTLPM